MDDQLGANQSKKMGPDFFHNAHAKEYQCVIESDLSPDTFHRQLPCFQTTSLTHIPGSFSGFDQVYVKDESQRIGLPSFKILGASWGTFRAIAKAHGLPLDSSIETVRQIAQQKNIHLVTATDGNHGRAIAYMARLLGVPATIFVPDAVNEYTRSLIRSEGANVVIERCGYDTVVVIAFQFANSSSDCLYIQDTSFEGYHEIPTWIVQGYTTMFQEIEEQLKQIGLKATHILTPVGVGSLAHAVVNHSKSDGRKIKVVAVESEVAACFQSSLRAGCNTSISTRMTIMDGINCGTVSDISWPMLAKGVDGAITISDLDSHEAVLSLEAIGINAGPCGASTYAALQVLTKLPTACAKLEINQDSVIVLLNTEGPREYKAPT